MQIAELQPRLYDHFCHILKKEHLSHAYLFSGDFGSFDMALFLAKSRFCQNLSEGIPCDDCRSCRLIANQEFADLVIVEPQGQIIKTDTIRELTRDFSRSGLEGENQFFIIKDADKMHSNAANSLLKFIEEPQSQSYLILLTSDDNKVLPTIKSRCQLFTFQKQTSYLEHFVMQQGLLKRQASLIAQVATSLEEARNLSENSKFLELAHVLERFAKQLNRDKDGAYLEVARLSVIANDKDNQDLAFRCLIVILAQQHQPHLLSRIYQARQMWQANVTFQNALEYFVLG